MLPTDVSKVVIYRNVALTHSNTQKDITEQKQKHAIFMGMGLYSVVFGEMTHEYVSLQPEVKLAC